MQRNKGEWFAVEEWFEGFVGSGGGVVSKKSVRSGEGFVLREKIMEWGKQ